MNSLVKIGQLSLDRLKLSNLYSTYFGMTPREQTIALAAAGLALLLAIILPVAVASSRIAKIEREASEGKRQIREVMGEIEFYGEKRAKLKQMQQMLSGGFDAALPGTIEAIAEANGIKDRIDSWKEKPISQSEASAAFDESSLDVRLKKLGLKQAVDFLFAIEHQQDKVLRLKQLTMKQRYDNRQELDVSFTVSTYRLSETATEEP